MIEIRPCRDREELDAYGRTVGYVFANNDTSDVEHELATTQPDWTMCAFVDGKLVSTMGTFPFTVRLNGAPMAMGGVTAVGTLPEQRRKGLLRKVMTQGLETMRDRGQSCAILWASMGAIYQRFGYGLASTHVSYRFDPRFAQLATDLPSSGSVSLEPQDDAYPIIKRVYIESATPRNLHIHRSAVLWDMSTLRPRKKGDKTYIAIHRNDAGEPRGYIVYHTREGEHEGSGPDQVMTVRDFVALDMDAWRGLWEYIRRHDLVGRVEMNGCIGEDDPAPDLLLEPRMLNRRTGDAIWLRVVDVEKALPQRPYGDRGEIVVAIDGDDACPWNNGSFLLETDGLTTEVRRTDRPAHLTLPPASLASLLTGQRTATHLSRAGRLEAVNAAALQSADRLFHTEYPPHCPDSF
ncbi:MAG TPA: GNAT family N-acetyltransferase [Tepidiformaceae bacterium]|nr:GNAT family N-acetyltransferase [Tepidiformaceae bacterium]